MLFGSNPEQISKESKRYALICSHSDFSLSVVDVKCAAGILILNGYRRLPSGRNYWEQQPDILTKIFGDNMRRNRFVKILLSLHVADSNNLAKHKKVGRVSEYLDELRRNFKTHCICDREFDIEKFMMEYFG